MVLFALLPKLIGSWFPISCFHSLARTHQPLIQILTFADSHHLLLQSKVSFSDDRSSLLNFFNCAAHIWTDWLLLYFSLVLICEPEIYAICFSLYFAVFRIAEWTSATLIRKFETYLSLFFILLDFCIWVFWHLLYRCSRNDDSATFRIEIEHTLLFLLVSYACLRHLDCGFLDHAFYEISSKHWFLVQKLELLLWCILRSCACLWLSPTSENLGDLYNLWRLLFLFLLNVRY